MRKAINTVIALSVASVMGLGLTACGETEKPGDGLYHVSVGPTEIELDANNYTQAEAPQELKDKGCTDFYEDDRDLCDVAVFHEKKTEGTTLEVRATSLKEELKTCMEYTDFDDGIINEGEQATIPCYSVPNYDEKNGEHHINNTYVLETDDEFVICTYSYKCDEIRLGDSDYYMWTPKVYESVLVTYEYEKLWGAVNTLVAGYDAWLPNITFWNWDESMIDYNTLVKQMSENIGTDADLTEEEFNEMAEDGFTLDEFLTYGQKVYGVYEFKEHMGSGYITGMQFDVINSNESATFANLFWSDNNELYVVSLARPLGSWLGHGGAFAHAIHKK